MNRIAAFLAVLISLTACTTEKRSDRIEELLSEMTLEEKVGQLIQYTGRWEMTGQAMGY